MSKEFYNSLDIHKYGFNEHELIKFRDNLYVKETWPVTYIISDEKIKEAYIGESTNAWLRMKSHLGKEGRGILSDLHVITSDTFNKSSALDIESSLIKYMAADGKYKLQNSNAGLSNHNYYQRDQYQELFKQIWEILKQKNLVSQDLKKIDNSDLFKYSPYKSLSLDQFEATLKLLRFVLNDEHKTMIVEGGAGTGKTVLATYFMKLLQEESRQISFTDSEAEEDELLLKEIKVEIPNIKIGFVIPMTSLRSTLKKVFRHVKGLHPRMILGPSDVVKEKYDLLLVDEAHRLHRRIGITNYASFDTACKKLGLDKHKATELDWIGLQSAKQILFYDANQSIRPSDIPAEQYEKLRALNTTNVIPLTSQMRVEGGNDYINFVDRLLNCRLDKSDSKFSSPDYELVLFDSFKEMKSAIENKEKEHGLSRLVAGYGWEWKSKNNSSVHDIEIEGIKMQWNRTNQDWINSPTAANEVGCIHTTQGYDLNYAGVIFGPEISYNPELNRIEIDKDKYFDRNGKVGIKDPEELKAYLINIYKTLMLRGVKGTYVLCMNNKLAECFSKYLKNITG